jgi:hypothetical protein
MPWTDSKATAEPTFSNVLGLRPLKESGTLPRRGAVSKLSQRMQYPFLKQFKQKAWKLSWIS